MELKDILVDNKIKPKEKTEILAGMILERQITIDELVGFAKTAKEPVKATCMEALEHATLQTPSILNETAFSFAAISLADKAPRVKWEAARVIGNTAKLFPDQLDTAVINLLANSEHTGTVVRWSAAFALCEIIKLKTDLNAELIPTVEAIIEREEKNSIKKIYLGALKKIQ